MYMIKKMVKCVCEDRTMRPSKIILLIPLILFSILFLIGLKMSNKSWCNIREEYPFKVNMESLRSGGSMSSEHYTPSNLMKKKYIHSPLGICFSHGIDILSVVKSAPGNFRRRKDIRKTWGKRAASNRNRLIFSIGNALDMTYQEQIDGEMERYKDILQLPFQDTYRNLTLKTIHSIQWTSQYCSSAEFVLFVDDDVLVDFKNLESFLKQLPSTERKHLITGYVVTEYPSPNRFETKFKLSLDEYPLPCNPPYISGPEVLTTGKMVRLFADAIPYVKPFVFEDVYLGIVASKLGIKLSPNYNHLFDTHGLGLHTWSSIISTHQGNSIALEALKMILSDL